MKTAFLPLLLSFACAFPAFCQQPGRFVRVELPGDNRILTLAEVEVIVDGKNIAPAGKAFQSSTSHQGAASRATDGNKKPTYKQAGQSHTEAERGPWWELDLGKTVAIERVDIWNRNDGTMGDRLNNFTFSILDAERNAVFKREKVKAPADVVRITTKAKSGKPGKKENAVSYLTADLKKKGRPFDKRKPTPTANPDAGPEPAKDPALAAFGIYERTAPKPKKSDGGDAAATTLPLKLNKGDKVVYIGNTLFDRAGRYGQFEAMVQHAFADRELRFRNLAWSADEVDLMPRPDNFGDVHQHLHVQEADVIFAAFGYNESFAGPEACSPN